jgi:rubredoxin
LSRRRGDANVNTLMPERECPLCGGTMQFKTTTTVEHIPGKPHGAARSSAEWVCPDCDYFEEAEGPISQTDWNEG